MVLSSPSSDPAKFRRIASALSAIRAASVSRPSRAKQRACRYNACQSSGWSERTPNRSAASLKQPKAASNSSRTNAKKPWSAWSRASINRKSPSRKVCCISSRRFSASSGSTPSIHWNSSARSSKKARKLSLCGAGGNTADAEDDCVGSCLTRRLRTISLTESATETAEAGERRRAKATLMRAAARRARLWSPASSA